MAQKIGPAYDTGGQAITITLASLATGAARESTAIAFDAVSPPYRDVVVQVRVKTQAGTPGAQKKVFVYIYGTADTDGGGPPYPDAVTGADAAITLNSPTQLKVLGVIEVPTASATFISEPMSVLAALGFIPRKGGIVVENQTNLTLSATEGDHKKIYQGLWDQVG